MLIRPTPLPDELGRAYKGRVMRYNGMSDPNSAVQTLMAWAGREGASHREVSTVELLAKVAGMDTASFVRGHTTLPLRRAVTSKLPKVHHGCTDHGSLLWASALRDTRPGAYFCSSCIHEDLDFLGTPFWRREHQLPGLYSCAKHDNLPLCFVETPNAFLNSPAAFLDTHHVVNEQWVRAVQGSGPVQRFLAISSDLMARPAPLDERDVSRAARGRANELGLHTGIGVVSQKLVSDLVAEQFDRGWLASVLPGLIDKPAGKYWPQVDGVVSGRRSGLPSVAYAVVFSALFESSDDAINTMIASAAGKNSCDRSKPTPIDATDEQLRAAYIANRGNHSAVSKQLGIGIYPARKKLLQQGLPSLGAAADVPSLLNAAVSVLIDGASFDQASLICGVSRSDLEKLLVKAAISFGSALIEIRRAGRRRSVTLRVKPIAPPRERQELTPAGSPLEPAYNEATPPQKTPQKLSSRGIRSS